MLIIVKHWFSRDRELFIDNLLVRIHFIIAMVRWTGLAPWEFEFPFPGSHTSTFLGRKISKWFEESHLKARTRVWS